MKKRKTKNQLTKGVLLISFIILFIRLIYASIGAFHHYKNNIQSDSYSYIEKKQQ